MNYAVIDLGSNTIRLSVYRYENNEISEVIRQKEIAGLAGYVKEGVLELGGIEKACCILNEFREIAVRFVEHREIHVFATASLRGVQNQEEAIKRFKQATGLQPEVLSGEEEARLDFIGVSHFAPCDSGILIDIGGASTELVWFENAQPIKLVSVPVGCLSLYTRFVSNAFPSKEERSAIKRKIGAQFDSIGWDAEEKLPLMIGVGGTVRAAHKLSCDLFSIPEGQNEIDAGLVKEILCELKNNENDIYQVVYKQIPERTLTITTGLLILRGAIKRFGCKSLYVSNYGIREGYLIDRVIKGI